MFYRMSFKRFWNCQFLGLKEYKQSFWSLCFDLNKELINGNYRIAKSDWDSKGIIKAYRLSKPTWKLIEELSWLVQNFSKQLETKHDMQLTKRDALFKIFDQLSQNKKCNVKQYNFLQLFQTMEYQLIFKIFVLKLKLVLLMMSFQKFVT